MDGGIHTKLDNTSKMTPSIITLETSRLLLKEVTPEYYKYLFDNLSDDELKEELCYSDADLNKAKARLPLGMTYYHITFKYFLLQDKQNQKTIGTCGFYRWYPEHDRAEFGYVMSDERYRKQGLMKEAADRLIRYGFEDMNIHRIEAFASPENTASVKILEGLGMKYEGLMREHFFINGKHEDSACYAILKHEYSTS